MSIVSNQAADSFLREPPTHVRLFLVHGTDEGLVYERTKAIVDNLRASGGILDRVEGDTIARSPGAFRDDAYGLSLFARRRIFWIDVQSRDIWPALQPLFVEPPTDCAIVVKAGIVKKGSALRTAFETTRIAVSVECYADEKHELFSLIDEQVREAGLSIASDARNVLHALLGEDRKATINELEKLTLYCRSCDQIQIDDVTAVISRGTRSKYEATINHALTGERAILAEVVSSVAKERAECEELMSLLLFRLSIIYRVRLAVDRGGTLDSAIQALGVALPFGIRHEILAQSKRYSSKTSLFELTTVRSAVANIRLKPELAVVIMTRSLLAICCRARR